MSTSPLSPTALPPLSPFLSLSEETLKKHLDLEEHLQQVGEELLEHYKESRQWKQVSQLAQTLNSNSERIVCLQHCLLSKNDSQEMEGSFFESNVTPLSVEYVDQGDEISYWLVRSTQSANQPVKRTFQDITNLKHHLKSQYLLQYPNLDEEGSISSDALQEFLILVSQNDTMKEDDLVVRFFSEKFPDFSATIVDYPTNSHQREEQEEKPTLTNDITVQDSSAIPLESGPDVVNSDESHINMDSNNSDSIMNQDNNCADIHKDESLINQETQPMTNGEINEEEEAKILSTEEDEATSSLLSDKSISNAQSFIQPHNKSDTSLSSPPQPSPLESSTVTEISNGSPSTIKAVEELKSVIGKTEDSSDELCSANDEEKPVASEPKASKSKETQKSPSNSRSKSVFYSGSSPSPPPSAASSKSGKSKKSKSFNKKNKFKEEVLEDPTVSLAAPQSTMEWDPTCLLEELYNDCRPGVSQSSTGENSRYSGHLDKLPVNQRKPTVMKGWKRRYFRLTRGSLFYYDDESSTKATSFIRLADSKIVIHPDSVKIEIIEKGSGNFIMLRAESKEELTTWHRVLQLEAVHPTMTHRLSLSPTRSTTILILDLGSCSVRAGLANDNTYPQLFFPNVCAVKDERVIACGIEALLPSMRRHVKLIYPCRHRVRLDANLPIKESFQCIIETTCKNLQLEPQNSSALVCISPVMSEAEQTLLVEVILEILGFQSILVQEQTTMALYSYNQTSGIVVSIGDSLDVVPIIDGYKVDSGCSHSPFGGHYITENLSKLATARDIRYFSETEMYVVRYIKENICFLSQDYPDDSIHCEESPSDYVRAVDVDRFQLPDHKKVIHLDSALFKAPEGLFTPGVWGKDVVGIQDMVQKAIEHCPLDMRREMSRRIYLAGGTTLLIGFQERLQKEVGLIFPRMEIQVQASENRHHASYLGAGVLASLNSFNTSLVTLDEWSTKGLEAMKPTKA